MAHLVALSVLLGLAVLATLLSALGVVVMRDPYQRLHFPAVAVSWASIFIIAAVWLDETDAQARIKVILVGLILFVMNAVLTHATAKAVRIWQVGHWEPHADERIEVIGGHDISGTHASAEEHEA